jgi:hypothetical protein
MLGSTVDAMAATIESAIESAVVLLRGVSRAYTESPNCQMEANYAMQTKEKMIKRSP